MYRFSLYVWQKQTTEKMFGSYPYPPNLYEQNTIEFISVLVKDGKPEIIPERVKEAAKITDVEWMNLTKQIWRLYPEDVKRARHPAPYPISLPSRLIAMYSFPRVPDEYEGDLILDPFNGTGSTCMAAKELGRNYVGLDLLPDFCVEAAKRIERTPYTGKIRLDEYGIQNKNGAKPKQQGQLKL
jgi:DNA modification methylase